MTTTILEYKIKKIEEDVKELKSTISNLKKQKEKRSFASLEGILKGKTDLSLKEIQSFKYNLKRKT